MREKVKSRLFRYSLIGFCFLLVVYTVMSGFGARSAMTIEHLPLLDSPQMLGLAYEDVSFASRVDGVLLKGWLLPGEKERAIIVVNGGYQNRVDDNGSTLPMSWALVAEGYSVLLLDLRGRGESEGTGRALCYAKEDIGGAVDYLNGLGYGPDDICIMGLCSGAALSSYYVSRNNIGALILDGCFVRVSTMVVREAEGMGVSGFWTRVFLPGLWVMSRLIYGFQPVNPVDIIDDINARFSLSTRSTMISSPRRRPTSFTGLRIIRKTGFGK